MTIRTRSLCVRFLLLALLGAAGPAAAQVPEDCPNVCNQTYALCIAASCDADTGRCGQCDATDGSCGYCYVFDGESCSYNAPCDQVAPSGDTVYSTYSEVLATQYGLQVMTCPSPTHPADCMDGKCMYPDRGDRHADRQERPAAARPDRDLPVQDCDPGRRRHAGRAVQRAVLLGRLVDRGQRAR